MALTAELVARIARTEPDPGPRPDLGYHSEQDYDDVVTPCLPSTILMTSGSLLMAH
jgi:hypothetical protein